MSLIPAPVFNTDIVNHRVRCVASSKDPACLPDALLATATANMANATVNQNSASLIPDTGTPIPLDKNVANKSYEFHISNINSVNASSTHYILPNKFTDGTPIGSGYSITICVSGAHTGGNQNVNVTTINQTASTDAPTYGIINHGEIPTVVNPVPTVGQPIRYISRGTLAVPATTGNSDVIFVVAGEAPGVAKYVSQVVSTIPTSFSMSGASTEYDDAIADATAYTPYTGAPGISLVWYRVQSGF